ncbi:MAG: YbhN family protein, partial [Parahaliea sp.]
FQATRNAALQAGLAVWLVILGLSLVNYLLRYWRWAWYLQKLTRLDIPTRWHMAYYFCGFALSTTPGKAGETLRSLYLRRHGVSYRHSLSTFFGERYLDLLSIVLLSSAAVFVFDGYAPLTLLIGLVALGALWLLHSKTALQALSSWSHRHPGRTGRTLAQLLGLVQSSIILLRSRELFVGLLAGTIAWLAEAVGFWFLLRGLGQDVSVLMAVGIYSLAILVGAISFLPGGLGSTEAVMALLLVSAGIDKPVAIAATLICRIATLWFAVFLGLATMGLLATRGVAPLPGREVEA